MRHRALDEKSQHLLRELTPQVLGILVRRYRDFSACEDAVQEALIAAATQWLSDGVPDNPRGWLIKVATRRLTDQVRADTARRLREQLVVSLVPVDEQIAHAADRLAGERDDTLDLYFMCCHPALTVSSQVALTLRAVGGLTTAEIARAFMVPESTLAQRISRAKQTIKNTAKAFVAPTAAEQIERLPAVLSVLYLTFSEGYSATSGPDVVRVDLSGEAIRVTRMLASAMPDAPEVTGLLALMLLTDARRAARTDATGILVPLDEQERAKWDQSAIAEGLTLLDRSLALGAAGPYQIQAAIAALHDQATSTETTDWPQILALYDLHLRMRDEPMTRLSRAIALAMVKGPAAGLEAVAALESTPVLQGHYRLAAARAHLLERAGDAAAAVESYQAAATRTTSIAEQHYLLMRAARLKGL